MIVVGCAADAPASDGAACEAQGLSSAYEAGGALAGGDGSSSRPEVASEEEGACALAGLKQGLSKRRGHGHHGGHGHHDEQKQCKADGKVVGQTAGALFCDLSIALGGIGEDELLFPGPESACSRAFEKACRHAFDRSIAEYAATIGDPSADCTVFAQGEFQRAYEIARHNQCLFSVGTEPPPSDCSDGKCECREQKACELDCQDESCEASCEHAESCSITSGGGEASCRHVGRCEADMDGPGTLRCEHAGSCDLTCQGPDCDIVCRHVGKCKARIDEGSVRCERTGKCQVECENGKKPRRTRDGRFVCDGRRDGDSCPPGHKR